MRETHFTGKIYLPSPKSTVSTIYASTSELFYSGSRKLLFSHFTCRGGQTEVVSRGDSESVTDYLVSTTF